MACEGRVRKFSPGRTAYGPLGAAVWLTVMFATPARVTGQTPAGSAETPPRLTVVAGRHYQAGWIHRLFLGAHYRDLWTMPVEVDVLDLCKFAGGLTPM